jgi:hypothetical protein
MEKNDQFKYIFWFLVSCTTFGFLYILLASFKVVPKENQHTVDIATGFIIGTMLTGIMSYFIGTTSGSQNKDKTIAAQQENITDALKATPPIKKDAE